MQSGSGSGHRPVLAVLALMMSLTGAIDSSLNLGKGYDILKNIPQPVLGSSSTSSSLSLPAYRVFSSTGSDFENDCPATISSVSRITLTSSTATSTTEVFGQGLSVAGEMTTAQGIPISGGQSFEYQDTVTKASTSSFTSDQAKEFYKWTGGRVTQADLSADFITALDYLPEADYTDDPLTFVKNNWDVGGGFSTLINNFGTHVITQAYGGQLGSETSSTTTATWSRSETHSYSTSTSIGAAGFTGTMTQSGSDSFEDSGGASTSTYQCDSYGSDYQPAPLYYELIPLHKAAEGADITTTKSNTIKTAIAYYIALNHVSTWSDAKYPVSYTAPIYSVADGMYTGNWPSSSRVSYLQYTFGTVDKVEGLCYHWEKAEACDAGYTEFHMPYYTTSYDGTTCGTTPIDTFHDTCVKIGCLQYSNTAWVMEDTSYATGGYSYLDVESTFFWYYMDGWEPTTLDDDYLTMYRHSQYPEITKMDFTPGYAQQLLGIKDHISSAGWVISDACQSTSSSAAAADMSDMVDSLTRELDNQGYAPAFKTDGSASTETGDECSPPTKLFDCSAGVSAAHRNGIAWVLLLVPFAISAAIPGGSVF